MLDGEVSPDELYDLAEYLNNDSKACNNWPGNQLVGPLQEIWADGVIDNEEIALMAKLLEDIQSEWSRKLVPPKLESAKKGFSMMSTFVGGLISKGKEIYDDHVNDDEARINGPDIQLTIPSHTSMAEYQVDLKTITCNCPDWKSKRNNFPVGHLTRFCKHVFTGYFHVEIEQAPPAIIAFLNNAHPPHPEKEWILKPVSDGGELVLISNAPQSWSDVYAFGKKGWGRFGYNIDEERWSYGHSPMQSDKIISMIKKHFHEFHE